MGRHLYIAQRLSAALLAPLVLIHLGLIIVAVRNGLSAEEILGRTRGNVVWGAFYSLFVIAAAVHAPLGLRNVLREWTSLSVKSVDVTCVFLAVLFLLAGMRAVFAVI